MHQQNLLRQQHLLIQFQQAELMRLQEEAARHRQCAEEAAAQATSCRSADVSPPHGAAVGWWFSPHAPEKRLAEEEEPGSPFSFIFQGEGISPWSVEGMSPPRFSPIAPKRLRF